MYIAHTFNDYIVASKVLNIRVITDDVRQAEGMDEDAIFGRFKAVHRKITSWN